MMKLIIAPLPKLHHHLTDGLLVVGLLMGLVHRHTHRPGAWEAGGGQSSPGQRHLVRVSWWKKSEKRSMCHAY